MAQFAVMPQMAPTYLAPTYLAPTPVGLPVQPLALAPPPLLPTAVAPVQVSAPVALQQQALSVRHQPQQQPVVMPVSVQRQPQVRQPIPWGTSTRLFSHPNAVPQVYVPPPQQPVYRDPGASDPHAEVIPYGETRIHTLTPMVLLAPSGRKKALVLGLQYSQGGSALRGTLRDAQNITQYLMQQGFPPENINMMTDQTPIKPTRHNALGGMAWLVQGAQAGDVLFFYFSGHGGQVKGRGNPYEADNADECIEMLDHTRILDDELYGALVKPLPAGVRMTVLMDCCHSGTGVDLPFHYYPKRGVWTRDRYPNYCRADVRMISGCTDAQKSIDTGMGGVLTTAYLQLTQGPISHAALWNELDNALWVDPVQGRRPQRPSYSATHTFDVNTAWDLDAILLDQSTNRNFQYQVQRAPVKQRRKQDPYDPYGPPPQKGCSVM